MQFMLGPVGRLWPAAFLGIAAMLLPASGEAQNPSCTEIDVVNPIFGIGGSAARPLITSFGKAFAALPESERISIVWRDPGACFAMPALVGEGGDGNPVPIAGTGARYWLPDGTELQCDFLDGDVVFADWGYMAANPEDCQGFENVDFSGIGNFVGPASGWSLITHIDSNQSVISAEALYFAYGWGDNSQAAPWNQEAFLFSRNPTSAALLAWVAATGLPAARWLGTDVQTNANMVTEVGNAIVPNAALGFVSSEVADRDRASVKTLAFQAKDQICGYLPDSSSTSFDKKNIREGRYWNWAYHRFYAPIDGSGAPTDPRVARFFDAITGKAEPTDAIPNLDLIIEQGTVPECAMRVARTGSYTALASFAPEAPCGCLYDFFADGSSSCDECTTTEDCTGEGQVCRHGFCEEW